MAHALLSKKFVVKAIFAEHFGVPGSTKRSYDEIMTVLEAMKIEVPVYMGEEGRPLIRVYTSINSRFILEDFISKLELVYGS